MNQTTSENDPGSSPPAAATTSAIGDALPDAGGSVTSLLGNVEPPGRDALLPFFNPGALPMVIALLLVTALGVRGLGALARRIGERSTQRRLAINQTNTLLGFAAWALAGAIAVSSLFDLSSQALFALSGTIAVAAGFLLKDVAESMVAGVSILVNKPFQVGDRITFGSFYGEVKEIGLRSVRLVTLDDNLVTIPSSKFLSEPVASANAGALECMVVIPFYLSPDADHERAQQIVRDAVLSSRFLYLGRPISVLLSVHLADEVGAVIEIKARAYVYDTRYEKQFASDVTDQTLTAFRAEGIAQAHAA